MISAVVLTKNEAHNIFSVLTSVKWCDEIIIIDDYSTDVTVQIAKKFGAKVYKRNLDNDFSKQRNFGLMKASNEWVLFLDADEIVPQKLKKEILYSIKSNVYDGFLIKRQDVWLGKKMKHGEFGETYLLRLGKKGKPARNASQSYAGGWKRSVHEYWDVNGSVAKLENSIIHYPHPTLKDFLHSINQYSYLHAKEHTYTKTSAGFWKIIFYPAAKFINNFIVKKGYKDGVHGFIGSMIMSFHSFLAWSTLWYIKNQKK